MASKRAMIATWSDNDSFDSESDDAKIANRYLMGRENTRKSDECEEVTLKYLPTFTKEYLVYSLLKHVNYKQHYITAVKALTKENKFLKKEIENL